ncbi:hypothetical protein E1176_15685 [Fulvivirga sp. RKSG066]|uniref:hypothetical protein n=1 Tax=Fulvivirga aurantia TaxID=2529383 RepID=UPI0012BD28A3|nr:hypothetical protein [Fulvivirga aurantia]MTI22474.1 hypothetical protein [Fulvivirga aurantia]
MARIGELPKWLKKTQQNSWEPEIFISGIVLYGLIQLPEYLQDFRLFYRREVFGNTSDIDNLVGIITTGIQWMTFGLVLHLFFRGIWIGLVGLSYVFPRGINHQRLNYKGKFEHSIKRIPDFTDQIIKLEKISSSIFSISYLIFMSILSSYLYLALTVLLPLYLFLSITDYSWSDMAYNSDLSQAWKIYAITMLVLGAIYLLDFLSLGLLKKIRFIRKIYYPFYVFMSFVTVSSLYRSIYYILISNFKRWKVISFLVAFVLITYAMININVGRSSVSYQMSQLEMYGVERKHFSTYEYYGTSQQGGIDQRATIQSDIVKDDVLRLFISHRISFEDSIKSLCNYNEIEEELQSDSLRLECMKKFFNIEINGEPVTTDQWMFHKDGNTQHRGVLTYINISDLETGLHNLDVNLENWFWKNYAHIPFYKE